MGRFDTRVCEFRMLVRSILFITRNSYYKIKVKVTLSAKSSLILGQNKAAFRREGHYIIECENSSLFRWWVDVLVCLPGCGSNGK